MKTQLTKKRFLPALALAPFSVLLMGNQSCEQQPVRAPLKKIVQLETVRSPFVSIPGVVDFDLGFVANQQLYGILMEGEGFAFSYLPPVGPSTIDSTVNRTLSSEDSRMFAQARRLGRGVNQDVHWSTRASCLVNLPMARITGSVNSFEMIGGGGINLGFTPDRVHTGGGVVGDVDFQVEFAQLDLSMMALHPLTNGVLSAVNVSSQQTKTRLSFGINLGLFRFGPSYFYQTPLSTVTKNGLTKAVKSVQMDLEKEPWFTRVLANHDTHLTIIGGRNVGLQVGDQLAVYNETYYWKGLPCESQYIGGTALEPVSYAEVASVGDEISVVKVTQSAPNDTAVIGAKVMVHKLVQPAPNQDLK